MAGQQPSAWIRGAVWALGAGFTVSIGLGSLVYHNDRAYFSERYDGLDEQMAAKREHVRTLSNDIVRLAEHANEHERTHATWQARIIELEKIVRELSHNARARPDPFTGEDGNRLRGLIDGNERRLDMVERCCDKVNH